VPRKIEIAPSLLAADWTQLREEVKRAEMAGADFLHLDVMDGHFVPNFSMGPALVAAVHRITDLPLEVHLMIYNPFEYIERCGEAGADRILFHLEATEDVADTLRYIRRGGVEAGLALNPETSPSLALKYLAEMDELLLMTVHPGFGGQKFIPEVLEKIRLIRETTDRLRIGAGGKTLAEGVSEPAFRIEVDGGIDPQTAILAREAGANVLVAGTSCFRATDMKSVIAELRGRD